MNERKEQRKKGRRGSKWKKLIDVHLVLLIIM